MFDASSYVLHANCKHKWHKRLRYGLDNRGTWFVNRRGQVFSKRPDQLWGPPSLLFRLHRVGWGGGGCFPWGLCGQGVQLITSSSAEVRNECELYRVYSVFLYGVHNNNITFAVIGMMRNKTEIKMWTSKVAFRTMKGYRGQLRPFLTSAQMKLNV